MRRATDGRLRAQSLPKSISDSRSGVGLSVAAETVFEGRAAAVEARWTVFAVWLAGSASVFLLAGLRG